jgi:phosphoglycerate dehydrogenase-like enzyme
VSQTPVTLVLDEEFASVLGSVETDLHLINASDIRSADKASEVRLLICQSATVDQTLLARLPNLQAVIKMGQSYHNIDTETLRKSNVPLFISPRKGPNCVAELAMTLMLALSKDLLIAHQSVSEGAYRLRGLKPQRTEQWKMAFHWMRHTTLHEVRGKTVGIVGMGEIGCELALRAAAMGMHVVYYKRSPLSTELEKRFQASYMPLEELLSSSDYVVLAVPHTTDTEKMIGAKELAHMKSSAYLINICRGGVIDEEALIEALSAQHIAGAGLDVFTFEPLPADSPLCFMDNVILTPHVGGGSGTNRTLELNDALVIAHAALSNPDGGVL